MSDFVIIAAVDLVLAIAVVVLGAYALNLIGP